MNLKKAMMNLALIACSATMFSPNEGRSAYSDPSTGMISDCVGVSKVKPVILTYMTYNIAHGRGNNPLPDYPTDTARDFRLICSRSNLERNLDGIADFIGANNPDIITINECDFVKDGFWSTWNFRTDVGDYLYNRLNMPYIVKGSKNLGINSIALAAQGKMKDIFDNCREYSARQDIWMYYTPQGIYNILAYHTGNTLFSRFKVEKSKTTGLRRYMEFSLDSYTDAQIDVKGIPVRVIMTHLDEDESIYQAKEILEAVKGYNGNIIISGDFNLTPKSKAMNMFIADGFRVLDAGCTYVPGKQTLDYIMVRGNIKILGYEVIRSDNSDHYPIIAILEIKK
ncbi:MAG: endonuclease/exonuclease/phosphatase family protein [Candidatus Woesearchaeota archaeon]